MQMIAQQTATLPSRYTKAPRWLQWMSRSRPALIKSIPDAKGGELSLKGLCPNLYDVGHISWAPDESYVSFVGNGRYIWLISANSKQTELLAMLPLSANQSLTNTWSASSKAFYFSYMEDGQLVDCEFDLTKRKLKTKELV